MMKVRNLSPQQMFIQMADEHRPECEFPLDHPADFAAWKKQTLPKVFATLGDFPETCPPNPRLIASWMHDGVRKERYEIDVHKYISAILQVNYPGDLGSNEKCPAILCAHGHGAFGKEPVMGNDSSAELRAAISSCNYNYGHEMAKQGYITYAIDWIGFGDRNDCNKPNFSSVGSGRDWCNLYYLHATMLGMTSISINVTHGKLATDFVCSLPQVDGDRLGVMGLSGGGTMTLWMTLCDERFKASEIICYSDLWQYFGVRHVNYCGMQVAPGLFKLVNLPDLQGLIAPRPLLIDIGANDDCFRLESSMQCFEKLEKIYAAAKASDKLELDLFPGPHSWGANKSKKFFDKYLSK